MKVSVLIRLCLCLAWPVVPWASILIIIMLLKLDFVMLLSRLLYGRPLCLGTRRLL